MGRLKKYNTLEDKKEAQRSWSRKYYWKNKKSIDKKANRKYHESKEEKTKRLLEQR